MPAHPFSGLAAALGAAPPPQELVDAQGLLPAGLTALAVVALLLSGFFGVLHGALVHSVPARVLEPVRSDRRRSRLEPLLLRAEDLSHAASLYRLVCDVLFALVVLDLLAGDGRLSAVDLGLALGICVPLLLLVGEMLPAAFAGPRSDALLRWFLPVFRWLQWPAVVVVRLLVGVRRLVMRALRVEEQPEAARRILEELRGAIAEADLEEDLDESERELIENVMEFHDVDVEEVMTPRTDVHAVEVTEGLGEAVRLVTECRHSRIPVYEGSLDRIVGVLGARDVLKSAHEGEDDEEALRRLMRPAYFVPESKLVSKLLAEFRRERVKIAIVLDEYGGTAGLVTLGDVLGELVGDFPEAEDETPAPVRFLPGGVAEVDAAGRISELNEELGLELPEEEDYETLAGFVLAELGHFPRAGETFVHMGVEYTVLEATDRRVLRVRVERLARGQSA